MAVQTTQVTVVGGGPVGLGLSIDLGQRGVSVVLVEKDETIHSVPKGQNLTQRTMEHFKVWGVETQVRQARIMPPGFPASGVNAYGHLLSEYAHPWFRRSQVGQYYFAANERLPQYLTEAVLRQRVSQLPNVTTRYGETATSVDLRGSGVSVTTDRGVIDSEYVVGCDGSHSVVRESIGIGEEIRDHDRRMVLLVFRSRKLSQMLEERFGKVAFFNVLHPDLDGYWKFLGTVDTHEEWFFHAPVASDATGDDLDYNQLLHETVGVEFPIDMGYTGFWDLRVAIANDYRSGRAFLAGDSAHSHPPYGGYGINTGFEDARNLGWKLAATIHGWAGDGLLDSYSAERRPVFVSTAADFIERFIERDRQFIADNEPVQDAVAFAAAWEERHTAGAKFGVGNFAPHYEGSPVVVEGGGPNPGAVGVHEFIARSGHHLPPLESTLNLFEKLGTGFSLLTVEGKAGLAHGIRDAASSRRVPLRVVNLEDMGPYETDIVLARPDHFISWVDDGSRFDPTAVIRRATGD